MRNAPQKRKKRPEVTPVVWRFKDAPRTSILTQSRWFITTSFLKYCFSVPPGSKKHEFLHFPKNVADTPQGCPNNVPKWRLFEKEITKHITVVIFFTILFHQMCCMKYWKVNFAYSKCHTDELKTSPKDVRKLTSFNVPGTSVFNLSYKHLTVVLFVILFHEMWTWNTKMSVMVYFYFTSQREARMLRFWGYLQDVNFEHILQKVF